VRAKTLPDGATAISLLEATELNLDLLLVALDLLLEALAVILEKLDVPLDLAPQRVGAQLEEAFLLLELAFDELQSGERHWGLTLHNNWSFVKITIL
jgi:hypothetical protein